MTREELLKQARDLQMQGVSLHRDYDQAITILKQALALYESADFRQGQANVWGAMGNKAQNHQDYAFARLCLEKSLALNDTIDNRMRELHLNQLAEVAQKQGDYVGARAYLEAIFELPVDELRYVGWRFYHLAQIEEQLNQLARVRELYSQAVHFSEIGNNPVLQAKALWAWGRLEHRSQSHEIGCKYCRLAVSILTAYLNIPRSEEDPALIRELAQMSADLTKMTCADN